MFAINEMSHNLTKGVHLMPTVSEINNYRFEVQRSTNDSPWDSHRFRIVCVGAWDNK